MEEYFINAGIDNAIKSYLDNINNKNGAVYNSFLVVTIRCLVLIYGSADIINPYKLKDKVAFFNNLTKYGLSKTDASIFTEDFLSFYNTYHQNNQNKIKVEISTSSVILKHLADMMVKKKKWVNVDLKEEEQFLSLLYTTHTNNTFMINEEYLLGNKLSDTENYYYTKLNEKEENIDLNKTISSTLNLEALTHIGVNVSDLKNMSEKEIAEVRNKTYNYFAIDAESPNRDRDLNSSLTSINLQKPKITSGNGYVDILLLMSVITTSFSIIAIIIFNL